MKNVFILIALALFVARLNGQNDAVKSAFAQKYPGATNVEWESEDGNFEVEFKLNGQETEASFAADGAWRETEIEIAKNKLPIGVKKAVSNQFEGYKIKEAEQISTLLWASAFEVKLARKKSIIEAVFSPAGELLHQESEETGEDDGDGQ